MSDKKLLWLSDSPFTTTGYATISTNICNRLAEKGWEVHYLAHNYIGQHLPPKGVTTNDGLVWNFHLWGMGREQYCKDMIVPRLRDIQPHVFGVLLDTFMLYSAGYMELNFAPANSVFYFPSDGGGGLPSGCNQLLSKFTLPIAMSRFGQKQSKDYYDLATHYIPHAVDTEVYFPLPQVERDELRKKHGLYDKFVVGVVARNQPRKMLDRTIKAFAKFCKGRDDAILFMHTDPFDNAAIFHLRNLIERFGIQNRVIFTGTTFFQGFDYTKMNEVYNLMDVFFLSTSGEGWGVPIIEAMACEVPVVATDYTTTAEIVVGHEAGFGVNLVGVEEMPDYWSSSVTASSYDSAVCNGTITGSWDVERGMMCIDDAVKKLSLLYDDRSLVKTMGLNGRKAVLAEYDWRIVADEWDKVLSELVTW